MIGGNFITIPHSLFQNGTTVSATLALNFGEASSKLETSSLIELALILFLITMVFQVARSALAGTRPPHDGEPGMSATAPAAGRSPLPARSVARRRLVNSAVTGAAWLAAALGIFVMGWIVVTVVTRGLGAWNLAFFTQLPPVGNDPGGGLANCIIGTLVITLAPR